MQARQGNRGEVRCLSCAINVCNYLFCSPLAVSFESPESPELVQPLPGSQAHSHQLHTTSYNMRIKAAKSKLIAIREFGANEGFERGNHTDHPALPDIATLKL